mmetsp:Transcript_33158/g.90765  ORF Transcript_33158/g.90765 Transcript_33158/m.90765 type:complete len:220 (-) Transcript_33158:505-1164(-)
MVLPLAQRPAQPDGPRPPPRTHHLLWLALPRVARRRNARLPQKHRQQRLPAVEWQAARARHVLPRLPRRPHALLQRVCLHAGGAVRQELYARVARHVDVARAPFRRRRPRAARPDLLRPHPRGLAVRSHHRARRRRVGARPARRRRAAVVAGGVRGLPAWLRRDYAGLVRHTVGHQRSLRVLRRGPGASRRDQPAALRSLHLAAPRAARRPRPRRAARP